VQGIFFVIVVVVAIAAIFYGWYVVDKRRKALFAWAQSRGLQFTSEKYYDFDNRFPAFSCLQQGSSRYAYNVITGSLADKEFLGFDYHYTTGSGKNRQDHHFSAIILQSPILLKPLFVRPENFLDKITEFAGFNDIDFESAEFSRKFYVKSPDKRWAYDVIHPQMMEFLMAAPVFTLQFDLTRIMASRNTTFSVKDYDSAIEVVEGMLERLPEYLVKQQQGNPIYKES
jgi:hypothetical protein